MNDLKTLIDLCPGIRLPQYEEEIFSDLVLAEYYLCKLCGQYGYYHGDSVPGLAYYYAVDVMGSRWPEAEPIIATDPQWAYYYASCVMESRWPEAEAIIATDAYWAYHYAANVMKCRWPEAEAAIATSPRWAYYYAKYVLGDRWPEAEAIIATDDAYRMCYNNDLGTNLTPPRNKIMAILAKLL